MPLGRDLLTSSFCNGKAVGEKDFRPKFMPRFLEANREQNIKVLGQFRLLADKKGCTVSQLALAWLLKQGDDIFPIPRTKQVKYLEENLEALEVALSDDDEAEIRTFVDGNNLAGGDHPAQFVSYLFRDKKEERSG
jgi:aryl-alcohol dehydrogenase-like predicted oxidoreductase